MPGWLRPLSYSLPPYWAVRSLQGATLGDLSMGEVVQIWLLLLVTSVLMLGLAVLSRARRRGTLGYV